MTLRVAFLQTRPVLGDVAGNRERAAARLGCAPEFDIAVLPELAFTGYVLRDRTEALRLGEGADGPTVVRLAELAAQRRAWIAAGFPERAGDRVYNAAALVGPRGERFLYRKIHLFDRERSLFDPGDRPFAAWTIATAGGDVRVGLMICFDWFFPESMRSLALDGAEVVLHPSNLVMPWCQDAMRTRCLENRVFAVTANRVGEDVAQDSGNEPAGGSAPGIGDEGGSAAVGGSLRLAFTGRSQIVDVRGRVLAAASEGEEEMRIVSIDPRDARTKELGRNDLFRDRRPELYRTLEAPHPSPGHGGGGHSHVESDRGARGAQ